MILDRPYIILLLLTSIHLGPLSSKIESSTISCYIKQTEVCFVYYLKAI